MSDGWIRRSKRKRDPLRVAYFSPLPPERSGIADYSHELLPYLTQHVEVTLYAADPEQVDEVLRAQYAVRELSCFQEERRQFDIALYQMGNSNHHASFYPALLHFPGIVVLHDFIIHDFVVERTLGQENFAGYAREMGYDLGEQGMHLAHAIYLGQAPSLGFEVALSDRVLDSSLGLIVHSAYTAGMIRGRGFDRSLTVVPALIKDYSGKSRRNELNLADDVVIFGSFGGITIPKQIEMALCAFKNLRESFPMAHYLLVGETSPGLDPEKIIRELNMVGSVTHIGYVPDLALFVDWVYTADVVINLRDPTVGETSATALRGMSAGRPLIVFDHGWYREIPDDAALKVVPLDEEMLLEAMLRLARSPRLRQQIGNAGRRYTLEVCHPAVVAEAYIGALHSTLDEVLKHYD